jgi:hypothetical protein
MCQSWFAVIARSTSTCGASAVLPSRGCFANKEAIFRYVCRFFNHPVDRFLDRETDGQAGRRTWNSSKVNRQMSLRVLASI